MAITRIITPAVTDDAVTLAKMAPGTDGNLITYDASGNPVAVATGNDGQVLTSTGAGSPPAFETLPVGGITVAHQWRVTTSFATTSTVPIASNWEQVDTYGYGGIGTVMSESSGVFSFPSTGIYLISISVDAFRGGDTRYWKVRLDTTTNNSSYNIAADSHGGIIEASSDTHDSVYTEFMFDVTNVSTHKVRFGIEADQSTTILGSTNRNQTCATFIRLGDT